MAPVEERTLEHVRREIGMEREELASAVGSLRRELRSKLPVAGAAALGAGFVISGGIGATFRLLFRRGRRR
jgi:hypothetical protein